MGQYHIYLKSGARIELQAYQILFPDPRADPQPHDLLRVYTTPSLEEPDGTITILKTEVAAVVFIDDTAQ